MPESRYEQYHLLDIRIGMAVFLAQQRHKTLAVFELILRSLVEVARELGKDLHLAVLCKLKTQRAYRPLHSLCLCAASDARHRESDIDSRALPCKEQLALQEYLSVGYRNDIGRDIC